MDVQANLDLLCPHTLNDMFSHGAVHLGNEYTSKRNNFDKEIFANDLFEEKICPNLENIMLIGQYAYTFV